MSVKKKLAATTLAVTVATTAFAGIPLSTKGLAEKLGISSVVYAADTSSSIKAVAAGVHEKLSDVQKADVRAARDAVGGLTYGTDGNLLDTIVGKINTKLGTGNELDVADKTALFNLLKGIGSITYDPQLSDLEDLLDNPATRTAVDKIAYVNVGGTGTAIHLTKADFRNFFAIVAGNALTRAASSSVGATGRYQIVHNSSNRNDYMTHIFTTALNADTNVSKVLAYHGITSGDIITFMNGLRNKIGGTVAEKAESALTAAYFNYLGLEITAPSNPGTGPGPNPGTNPDPDPEPEPGTEGPEQPAPVDPGQVAAELGEALSALKDKLATASDDEKQAIVDQAVSLASAAAAKILKVDANDLVTIVGGKAELKLDKEALADQLEALKKIKAGLEEFAGAAFKAPALEIDLKSDNGKAEVSFSSDLLEEAADLSVSEVSVVFNGFGASVTIAPGGSGTFSFVPFSFEFAHISFTVTGENGAGTTLASTNEVAVLNNTSSPRMVSDAYYIALKPNGKETAYYQAPIQISVPVTGKVSRDFVTVAKLDGEKISYENGFYNAADKRIVESTDQPGTYFAVERKVDFPDINDVRSWAGLQIQSIASKGVIDGRPNGNFDPRANITRAEFAKMIVRALNLELSTATHAFGDVVAGSWYEGYVAAAYDQGIVNGRGEGRFAPNANITRAEMATMIARAAALVKELDLEVDIEEELAVFADADRIHESLRAGVAFAASANIVIGDKGNFNPSANATRAQAAVAIYRALNL